MANRIITIQSSEIRESNRFEPKLYLFQNILKRSREKYEYFILDDIATAINRGQSPKPDTYKDKKTGKYVFIRTADVKKFQFNTETATYLSGSTFLTQKSNRVTTNDILMSVVGNYLGSTSVIPTSIENGVFNDNSARIRITDHRFSPYYVSAFFNSIFGQELIQSLITRTGQKILSAGNVKKLSVPLIEHKELSKKYEAATLKGSEANELILRAQNLLYSKIGVNFSSIMKEKFYSVMKNDFAQSDLWTPTYSYPQYVNTLNAILANWKMIKIGDFVDIIKGDEVGSESYISYTNKRKSDVPFIRTSDIVNYEIDQYPDFYIAEETYEELNQGFQDGDVLFTKDGKIGVVGMITSSDKAIISSGFSGLRLKANAKDYGITSEYLFLVLSIKEIGLFASKEGVSLLLPFHIYVKSD